MELRDYQKKAVEIGIDYFHGGEDKPSIIVAPTAYGKSVVISAIANQLEGKTIVLQPSKELLEQNYNKLIALGGEASIYSASFGKKEYGKITYATIGSIKKLGKEFKDRGYINVIVDECHLYPPNSDSMFGGFIKDLGHKKVLGLTATPFRLQTNTDRSGYAYSKLAMLTSRSKSAGFFKRIVHVYQISDIVKNGYWSKLDYESWDFSTGELRMNSAGSDFTESSIVQAFKDQSINRRIANRVNNLERKSVLVFVPTVELANELSAIIPDSIVIFGDMPKTDRDIAIKEFRAGFYRVAINVNVLSVGFDYPNIDCIVLGRPTASLAWYYQAIGRGTRISPTKNDCLVIDFVGNTERFGKIEGLSIEQYRGNWEVFSGDIQLTSIPITDIGTVKKIAIDGLPKPDMVIWPFGKYKDSPIDKIPTGYLNWVMENFTFNKYNEYLKPAITAEIKARSFNKEIIQNTEVL